jgi:multisubunit Na+/H+ antiporter MnhG subunit
MTLEPRSGRSALQIRDEVARRKKVRREELALTRARATSWAKGIGALLVVGLAFGLVRGRSDISTLATGWAIAVGVALVVAVLLAAVAAYYVFRAAYGRLTAVPPERSEHALAMETMDSLRTGLRVACAAVLALLTGVAFTWYGPAADGAALHVFDRAGGEWCGSVVRTDHGVLTLELGGHELDIQLADVKQLRPVKECPSRP